MIQWRPVIGSNGLVVSQDGRVGKLTRGSLDGDSADIEVRELSCERGHDRLRHDRLRRVRIRVDGVLKRVTVRELVAVAWLVEGGGCDGGTNGTLSKGWSVKLRSGIVDPIGLDDAGILTVVDARGREQVSAAGREIQRAWDRDVVDALKVGNL